MPPYQAAPPFSGRRSSVPTIPAHLPPTSDIAPLNCAGTEIHNNLFYLVERKKKCICIFVESVARGGESDATAAFHVTL